MAENTTVEITTEVAAQVAEVLAKLRTLTDEVRAEALTGGEYVVAAMSASGTVKTETANSWHLKGGGEDLWGIAYKVTKETAKSTYQRDGQICGFARSAAEARADVAEKAKSKVNGRQKIVGGSVLAMPAYVVKRDELPALREALRVAYEAWLMAEAGTLPEPAPKPAPRARRARKSA